MGLLKTAFDQRQANQRKTSRYRYYPCQHCAQVVAHTKNGEPLHMHRKSRKCQVKAKRRVEGDW